MECKLLSHPDKLLYDHLSGAYKIGLNVFNRNGLFPECKEFVSALLLLHDLGKASNHFQKYIKKSGKVYEELKRHGEISALWFYFYAKEVLKIDEKQAVLGYIIIKHHHADFTNFRQMCTNSLNADTLLKISESIDYDELCLIYKNTLNLVYNADAGKGIEPNNSLESNNRIELDFFSHDSFKAKLSDLTRNGSIKSERQIKKELKIEDYLFLNYFFSILLTADKCDAIVNHELNPIQSVWRDSFVDNYKQKFEKNDEILTKIRNESYLETEANLDADSRFFSINLPTGAGKTLTVLNAALKLKDKQNNKPHPLTPSPQVMGDRDNIQRIIYCLPFTSVIDQNAKVFEDILEYNGINITSDVILKHHHLTELEYIARFQDEDKIYSSKDSEFFIEGWESEFIVTTFHQLLHTMLSNRNKVLRKFHNLANSIIVLDEVQTIPSKFWDLIKTMFQEISELFNIRFILVTATMPLIFSEADNEIKELALSKKHYFDSLSRIKLNTENLKEPINIDDFKYLLLDDIEQEPEKSRLIILNTIKASLDVYSFLKEHLDKSFVEKDLIYLSSNIIPKERLRRILEIKRNPKGKVIVSTQLVEAGVDIDVDVVYRDMAPLDSIFQSCGRCNRNNHGKSVSEVKLYMLTDGKKAYNSYIYDNVLIDVSSEILKSKSIFEEKEFLSLSKCYFEKMVQRNKGSESEKIVQNIGQLLLNSAFVKDKNNSEPIFKLIDSFPVISAFIEADNEAKEILTRYEEIKETIYSDQFEKRIALKEIYRKMSPYLINIPEQSAKKSGYDETLGKVWFIKTIILDNHYDMTTGFKRDQEVVDYIF
ncbi:MAG: CRISPR-associated helicase Cas3' [Desulfamplus sp.]|nr:CRISPR-associated helicase Cas3' [Desulfamplus sp.]